MMLERGWGGVVWVAPGGFEDEDPPGRDSKKLEIPHEARHGFFRCFFLGG